MKKKEHEEDLPPLYEVEIMPVERRLNVPDRRAAAALRKAARRRKTRKELAFERRRHPGRRATDPKPQLRKKS
ncbi:MAG TPA: hypothetical protein VLX30_15470 [Burkholderiales bacterium]|nr:hypothetical protein [Burkholderiales bacterium]